MAIESKQVQVAKELDDVGALLVSLVAAIKAKKDLVSLLSEEIKPLMEAVNGIDQVKNEIAENKQVAAQTIGARVGELVGILLA